MGRLTQERRRQARGLYPTGTFLYTNLGGHHAKLVFSCNVYWGQRGRWGPFINEKFKN